MWPPYGFPERGVGRLDQTKRWRNRTRMAGPWEERGMRGSNVHGPTGTAGLPGATERFLTGVGAAEESGLLGVPRGPA